MILADSRPPPTSSIAGRIASVSGEIPPEVGRAEAEALAEAEAVELAVALMLALAVDDAVDDAVELAVELALMLELEVGLADILALAVEPPLGKSSQATWSSSESKLLGSLISISSSAWACP